MSAKSSRYHPVLVLIHWTSAILIPFTLHFGTLFHQVIRKDNLMARMSFGKKPGG